MSSFVRWIMRFWLMAGTALAHEHWILLDRDGDRASVRICSGHAFPASEMQLSERLLTGTVLIDPEGVAAPFQPKAEGLVWQADVTCNRPGVWAAEFALQRPLETAPLHRGRSLLIAGDLDDPARYADGKGLEIVPQGPLSGVKPGDHLPVALHLDGVPLAGRIAVIPVDGSVAYYSTGRNRPAEIPLRAAGAYLLATSHQGRGFSLTFSVPPAGETLP